MIINTNTAKRYSSIPNFILNSNGHPKLPDNTDYENVIIQVYLMEWCKHHVLNKEVEQVNTLLNREIEWDHFAQNLNRNSEQQSYNFCWVHPWKGFPSCSWQNFHSLLPFTCIHTLQIECFSSTINAHSKWAQNTVYAFQQMKFKQQVYKWKTYCISQCVWVLFRTYFL